MSKSFKHYWGIDVSKNWLDVALNEKVFRIEQTEKAINQFIKNNYLDERRIIGHFFFLDT